MKSRIQPQYSQKELKIMGAYVDKRVQDCLSKVQWLMLLAFHDVLGDEIADQKLTQAVQAILPNHFSQLYE